MFSEQLLTDFVKVLGKDNVIADRDEIGLAEQATYQTTQHINLILQPETKDQLKSILATAQEHKQPIYVVSQGKNWGYGSRVPNTTNNVLVELKKLNRILDYNEQLAYITVEPGVTFDQVFSFLRERNSELIISTTGSSGDTSLIGNVLERGIGTGLYADRFSHVCGFEVMLPNGTTIQTGFEKNGDYSIGKLNRWGSGPSLDGLFSQSNLGIVTKMTIWLLKVPRYLSIGFYKTTDDKLPGLVDKLQALSIEGLLRPAFTIYNEIRILSSIVQYPTNTLDPAKTNFDTLVEHIKKAIPGIANLVGQWNGEISFRSANQAHIKVQEDIYREELTGFVDELVFINLSKEEILNHFKQHHESKEKNLAEPSLKPFLLKKYSGIPDNSAIRQSYWRKRLSIPQLMNPDKDKCGIIWICPSIPFNSKDVIAAIDIIKKTIKDYFFEPAVSLQCLSERSINIIASFSWDREIEWEEKNALECYKLLNEKLSKEGYFSYRNTTISAKRNSNSTDEFLSGIKKAIDPNNILSPGRYIN